MVYVIKHQAIANFFKYMYHIFKQISIMLWQLIIVKYRHYIVHMIKYSNSNKKLWKKKSTGQLYPYLY